MNHLARQAAAQKLSELKKVENPNDMQGHTYCLIIFSTVSVYIPGDERSRSHPGHGYPGGMEYIPKREIYVCSDKKLVTDVVTALLAADPTRKDLVLIYGAVTDLKLTFDVKIDF